MPLTRREIFYQHLGVRAVAVRVNQEAQELHASQGVIGYQVQVA